MVVSTELYDTVKQSALYVVSVSSVVNNTVDRRIASVRLNVELVVPDKGAVILVIPAQVQHTSRLGYMETEPEEEQQEQPVGFIIAVLHRDRRGLGHE